MNIVGVDLSLTATGICAAGCGPIVYKPKAKGGMYRIDEIAGLVDQCTGNDDLIVIEGYSFGSKGRAVFDIAELGGVVRHLLYERGWPYVDVPPTVLKKFATGKGNVNKDAMVATAARAGCPADDNNAVDAWWLRQMGLCATGQPPDGNVPMTDYRRQAIAAVGWAEFEAPA